MNRSGSILIQDAKGRDRERYPIVYGARLKVRDGWQHVEQGTIPGRIGLCGGWLRPARRPGGTRSPRPKHGSRARCLF